MKLATRTGGIVLIVVVVVLALVGFATATGMDVLGSFGTAFRHTGAALRTVHIQVPTRTAGIPLASAFASLALFALTIVFVPPARTGRPLIALVVAVVVVGFVLYQPALLGGGS